MPAVEPRTAADHALREAEDRLAAARVLEALARDVYAAARRRPDPAAVRAARDRLSGIETTIAQLHAASALAERRLRAARPEESARA